MFARDWSKVIFLKNFVGKYRCEHDATHGSGESWLRCDRVFECCILTMYSDNPDENINSLEFV